MLELPCTAGKARDIRGTTLMLDRYRFACDTSDLRQEAVHDGRPGPRDARDDTEQTKTDRACGKGEQASVPRRNTIMPAHCVAAVLRRPARLR